MTVEVEGGGGPLSVQVVEGVDEQGDGGLVHCPTLQHLFLERRKKAYFKHVKQI